MARKKPPTETKVESIRHKDKRTNIPTEELRDFIADDEQAPKTMLYPRDPSLDPQLVWRGKDEQDRNDLAVPVVPIYIQEKIHPQAIIDDLRARPKSEAAEKQLSLFSDFNGIDDFDKKIDFYHHAQHWSNRMILGDSLLVMTSLAEKEGLKGKVQTIYFDPPYGMKFGSNWQVSTRKPDVKDGKFEDATRQPEQIHAFRDTWKYGVHSYLSTLRDRLVVARELLTETGSMLIQIGDENVHLVRSVLDEAFGSENFVSQITVVKTSAQEDKLIANVCDHILWYARSRQDVKYRQIWLEKTRNDPSASDYNMVLLADGSSRRISNDESLNPDLLPRRSRIYTQDNIVSQRPPGDFPVQFEGKTYRPITGYWKTGIEGMKRLDAARRLERRGSMLRYVRYLDDFTVRPIANFWADVRFSSRVEEKSYMVQTAARVVERSILMTTDPGDLVLDLTCVSGATAYVAEQWGRRWITIDTSRVALALARTRLMAAKYPYYLLADSPDGIKKEAELTGQKPPPHETDDDIRKGFVYKRVPHVTLKSIANNPDITEGMTRAQIDEAIARHAETETLFDKPYEDTKRIRVSGPFTVESLSPHRVLATDDDTPRTETEGSRESTMDFATMVLDNLKKAGVQNTVKKERLKFDTLEPFAGTWLQASGTSTAADGKLVRVAVSVGPEHGTVGPQQVKEAAKEAVLGIGFDILVVCGFAFGPHVAEEAKRYGKLTVLPARMNPDLLIGTGNEALLKNTGAGNLFMVFGEPAIEVSFVHVDGPPEGMYGDYVQVEIKGVDVYDPTTGQIRDASTDDIACWFIDTDYNGESFFVRHAYFIGADEPYEKLKRALKAEVDEDEWSSLYSTTSRLFPKPETGKIAVKVINHYGDEVLKVITL
jgi:adenine-specific DNA-methyltransferase